MEKGRGFIFLISSFLAKSRGDQEEKKTFLPGCGCLVRRGGSLAILILVGLRLGRACRRFLSFSAQGRQPAALSLDADPSSKRSGRFLRSLP